MKKPQWHLYALQSFMLAPIIYYWFNSRGNSIGSLDFYAIFPLLGLIAFSMMWLHLMVAFFKSRQPDAYEYSSYYKKTSHVVLVLLILHPLLLVAASVNNDTSFLDYAGDEKRIFILFGSLALMSFLVYEVVNRMRDMQILKENWQYVVAMNRIGFILVYVHGLQLGQHLQSGWLRSIWLFYGVTTAAYIIWAYRREIMRDKTVSTVNPPQ